MTSSSRFGFTGKGACTPAARKGWRGADGGYRALEGASRAAFYSRWRLGGVFQWGHSGRQKTPIDFVLRDRDTGPERRGVLKGWTGGVGTKGTGTGDLVT